MPQVCCLTRKSDGKSTEDYGITFQEIDDAIRQHFQAPANPDEWYNNWYNHHAFLIALGKTLPEIIQEDTQTMRQYQLAVPESDHNDRTVEHYRRHVAIGEYLLEHFDTAHWREFKYNSAKA